MVALLLTHKATVDLSEELGATPLLMASINGHREVAALLLDHNASVDQ